MHTLTNQLRALTNRNGIELRAIDRGAAIVSLLVPDRNGKLGDIVLGYDTLDHYVDNALYLGAVVGRYANRIANASFHINGIAYTLSRNSGSNTLHGGYQGFDKAIWKAVPQSQESAIAFAYESPDGEEGFPGNLKATVRYTLTDSNEWIVDYEGECDKPTPVNLTQHSYFNLAGEEATDILSHELMLNADRFIPVDYSMIPTGELRPVRGTPMDFTKPRRIGERIEEPFEQLLLAHGYDHSFVINRDGPGLALAARVREAASGRVMEVHTTEPGVHFYSGNLLHEGQGKRGTVYGPRRGFCLETQHFPDSPNRPEFPSTILRPGEIFRSRTVFRFLVEK